MVVERYRRYGEACDAAGRAALFAVPSVAVSRRGGDPGYRARLFADRHDLAASFRCDAGLEAVEEVHDGVVVRPAGDRAFAAFRHRTKLAYLNHCAEAAGRTAWWLERGAAGGWLVVGAVVEADGPVPVAC